MVPEIEWRYNMRRHMQEVYPGLYLGPLSAVCEAKLPELETAGITHVLCVRSDVEASVMRPKFPQLFTYMEVEMTESTPLSSVLPQSLAFISSCREGEGRCLVQGFSGACRSAAIAVAFIMFDMHIPAVEAVQKVAAHRFCLTITPELLEQLRQYDAEVTSAQRARP
ncbi:serine/threonine/tyrosine-interacting protein A isoform X2 [Hyalella azteca]|nr:serine/threonine/tyrosine-interacting protein A isoform X2 [Hyalella azteca]